MDYYLARLPIFRSLPREALEGLGRIFLLNRYAKGERIFEDAQEAHAVYLLRSGLVKAVKYSSKDEPVIMEIITPGRVFGMLAVMDKKSYPVSAVCLHPSEAYRVKSSDFLDLLNRYPSFSQAVYAELGRHMRHAQTLRALAQEPAEKKIAYILYLLSKIAGPELKLRRAEIAEMAGTTLETAIRIVNRLRKDKLISARWGQISVLKSDRLKALSGQN